MSRLFCADGHDGGGGGGDDDDDDDDIVIAIAIAAAVIVVVVVVVIIITTIVVPKQSKYTKVQHYYQHNMLQFTIPKALYTVLIIDTKRSQTVDFSPGNRTGH